MGPKGVTIWFLGGRFFFRPVFFLLAEQSCCCCCCFLEDWDFHSVNTNTQAMVTFSFNSMAIVCVIANLFFY